MLKIIALSLLILSFTYGADESPKKSSFADEAFTKAVDANASDAIKAYSDYITKLDGTNKKVLAALELIKKDLNDTNKNKNLNIQERADAIKAIDEKIAMVKEGGVGGVVEGRVVAKGNVAGDARGGIKIISATFGAKNVSQNVTEKVQAIISASNEKFQLNDKILGDPLPGESKTLTIVYTINGKKKSASFHSWDYIDPASL